MSTQAVSRQRRWQLAKSAVGLCPQCGQRIAEPQYVKCAPCNQRFRARTGFEPWQPGHRGRPPKRAAYVRQNNDRFLHEALLELQRQPTQHTP